MKGKKTAGSSASAGSSAIAPATPANVAGPRDWILDTDSDDEQARKLVAQLLAAEGK